MTLGRPRHFPLSIRVCIFSLGGGNHGSTILETFFFPLSILELLFEYCLIGKVGYVSQSRLSG